MEVIPGGKNYANNKVKKQKTASVIMIFFLIYSSSLSLD